MKTETMGTNGAYIGSRIREFDALLEQHDDAIGRMERDLAEMRLHRDKVIEQRAYYRGYFAALDRLSEGN